MPFNLNVKRAASIGILVAFLVNILGPIPTAKAEPMGGIEGEFHLPVPGILVHLSPEFNPPILKGLKVHPDNPFRFDFILDQGDNPRAQLETESTKLIKYFLASLTIPEKDLWVNLSPYEKDRIIPHSFGVTEMGRDLLAEDYMLKQITASLIYPEEETGKKFWKRIYEEAAKKFGTTNIPVSTFNKVWIVPEKAVVYENAKAGTAYVVESKLKVMLEQDYLSLQKHSPVLPLALRNDVASVGADIVREIVLPELTKEINENKNFSQLRQVYNSLILATWYKKKIKDSILEEVYTDKNKIAGVGYKNSLNIELIYQRYLQAFKKGAYNYIKDDIDPLTQETIPRKYFSGGFDLAMTDSALKTGNILSITHDGHFMDAADDKAMDVSAVIDPQDVGLSLSRNIYSNGQSPGFADTEEIIDFLRRFPLVEGHVHFGSSVPKEVLWELAVKRTELNWRTVDQQLTQEYGRPVDIKSILEEARALLPDQGNEHLLTLLKEDFFKYITFKLTDRVDLKRFNTIYKIIGLLTRGSQGTYQEIAKQIALENYKNGVKILIQRATVPVDLKEEEIYQRTMEKINAIKNGFEEAGKEINSRLSDGQVGFDSRLVFTVERYLDSDVIAAQTRVLLRILEEHADLRQFIVGFDVADNEALKSPTQMMPVLELIEQYNAQRLLRNEKTLALTYHVGEDFRDVTLESGIRHADEVVEMGAAGIGHGLVLGVNPERFLGKVKNEHISERLTQIYYDLKNARFYKKELDAVGLSINETALWQELASYSADNEYIRGRILPLIDGIIHGIQADPVKEKEFYSLVNKMKEIYPKEVISIRYDTGRVEEIRKRQRFVLNKLIEKQVVIEANPSSNVLLGPIKDYKEHPLPNFLTYEYTGTKEEFKHHRPIVTLNTDDPTIFGVDLMHEYVQMISAFNLTQDDVVQIIMNGIKYRLGAFDLKFSGQIKASLTSMQVSPDIDREDRAMSEAQHKEKIDSIIGSLKSKDFKSAGVEILSYLDQFMTPGDQQVGVHHLEMLDLYKAVTDHVESGEASFDELEFIEGYFNGLRKLKRYSRSNAASEILLAIVRSHKTPEFTEIYYLEAIEDINAFLDDKFIPGSQRKEIKVIENELHETPGGVHPELLRIFEDVRRLIFLGEDTDLLQRTRRQIYLDTTPKEQMMLLDQLKIDAPGSNFLKDRGGKVQIYKFDEIAAASQPFVAYVIDKSGIPLRMVMKDKTHRQPVDYFSHLGGTKLLATINAPIPWVFEGKKYIYIREITGREITDVMFEDLTQMSFEDREKLFFSLGISLSEAHILGMTDRPRNLIVSEHRLDRLDISDIFPPAKRAVFNIDRENVLKPDYLKKEPEQDIDEATKFILAWAGQVLPQHRHIFMDNLPFYLEGFKKGYLSIRSYFRSNREKVTRRITKITQAENNQYGPQVLARLDLPDEKIDRLVDNLRAAIMKGLGIHQSSSFSDADDAMLSNEPPASLFRGMIDGTQVASSVQLSNGQTLWIGSVPNSQEIRIKIGSGTYRINTQGEGNHEVKSLGSRLLTDGSIRLVKEGDDLKLNVLGDAVILSATDPLIVKNKEYERLTISVDPDAKDASVNLRLKYKGSDLLRKGDALIGNNDTHVLFKGSWATDDQQDSLLVKGIYFDNLVMPQEAHRVLNLTGLGISSRIVRYVDKVDQLRRKSSQIRIAGILNEPSRRAILDHLRYLKQRPEWREYLFNIPITTLEDFPWEHVKAQMREKYAKFENTFQGIWARMPLIVPWYQAGYTQIHLKSNGDGQLLDIILSSQKDTVNAAMVQVSLRDMIDELLDTYIYDHVDKVDKIGFEEDRGVMVSYESDLGWTILELIENALDERKGKERIKIELIKKDGMAGVRITNNGGGIDYVKLENRLREYFDQDRLMKIVGREGRYAIKGTEIAESNPVTLATREDLESILKSPSNMLWIGGLSRGKIQGDYGKKGNALYIIPDLIEEMRGKLEVSSHDGHTAFTVLFEIAPAHDSAMSSFPNGPGGIDLTPARMNVQTKTARSESGDSEGIIFHLDPAMLAQFKNTSGFVPVIIKIRPINDLRAFLDHI